MPRCALRIGSSCTREARPREGPSGHFCRLAVFEGGPGAGGRAGFPSRLAPGCPDPACAAGNWPFRRMRSRGD